jgi:hypothetical protein
MKRLTWIWGTLSACTFALTFAAPASAQDKKDDKPKAEAKKPEAKPETKAQDKKPSEKPAAGAPPVMDAKAMAEMTAQMEKLAAPGENHKLLEGMVGDWTFVSKFWMDPSAPPSESTGNSTTKAILGGRFFHSEHTGKVPMPGPDGKMVDKDFHGIGVSGFDNVKQKFTHTWIDNFGTMIMMFEGTYDPGTKTFTYTSECEMMPGMSSKVREVIKVIDKDKHVFEWYETRGPTEVKTMEITYTRKK